MTLKEAIQQVLQECGGITTTEEIARRINVGHLYHKEINSSFVIFGVKNYLAKFEVLIRLRA